MAIRASPGRNRVSASQWESHRIVIEFRTQPVVRPVALVASRRVGVGDVARCRRALVFRFMARIAHRGHDLELAVGRVLVAGIAIHRRVRAGQRETIIVLLNFLDRYAPSAHGVALLAIGAQLALMNVGVAVLAAGAHIVEHGLNVALDTGDILVHAAQRIMALIVIEFGNGADRSPARWRVTVLAWNVQNAVWAMGARGALGRAARERTEEQQ